MSKKHDLEEASTLLSRALRHKIGSFVNFQEPYADRYAKDYGVLLRETEKVLLKHYWNSEEKKEFLILVKKKLAKELEAKTFLNVEKYALMDDEVNEAVHFLFPEKT